MPKGKPLKYAPLRRYLLAQSGETVMLTFAEIEAILDAPLPESAWVPAFWANLRGQQPMQMQAWWSAGWRVAGTTLKTGQPSVMFERR